MKNRLLLLFVIISVLNSTQILAQSNFSTNTQSTDQATSLLAPLTSPIDSLAGFDELGIRYDFVQDGTTGEALELNVNALKRDFINRKYFPSVNQAPNSQSRLGAGAVSATPCVNEGFELGNISGWNFFRGRNQGSGITSCIYLPPSNMTVSAFPNATLGVLVTTPSTQVTTGGISTITIPNSPFPGNKVIRLNDGTVANPGFPSFTPYDYAAARLTQAFPVTSSNFVFEIAYMAFASSNHVCCQQPYMQVAIRTGTSAPACTFTFAPPPSSGPSCSSSGITWSVVGTGTNQTYYNPTWQRYSIDLSNFAPSTVTMEVTSSDCNAGGHYMISYFDSNCGQMLFTLNGSTSFVSPSASSTLNMVGVCGNSATIQAPSGFGPYNWTGPSGFTSTAQTITTNIAGTYTINMSPPGACFPIWRYINLTFAPTTTLAATPATVCSGSSSTLSAIGATSYTWNPGNIVSASTVVNPTSTTIYSLTATTGTCIGNYTQQISVNPLPTIVPTSPSGSVCGGNSTTLSATGGLTYTWLPMNTTGSTAVVAPIVNTSYTAIGTDSNNCVGSGSLNLGVSITPTMTAVQLTTPPPSGSFCVGSSVQLIAVGGAATVTWSPGGSTSFFNTITAGSSNTTYTLVGASGACQGTAAVTVSVDPGPTMTLTSSPAISCPYIIGTLTAIAPSTSGFTWAPPGTAYAGTISTHTVNPPTTTPYTVQGVNSNGCRSTYTINQVVSPASTPTITASSLSICIGGSVSYTASGGTSYTWNPGGLTGATRTFTPLTSTNYTIISSNGTCTNSTTQSITVVPIPTIGATASPTAICVGATAALTATGGASYTWNPGGSTSNPFNASPASNTTYTVTGSVAGCTSNAVVSLVVNALPNLTVTSSPTAICPGVVANIISTGATNYTVMPGSLVGSNVMVSPASTQIYTVTGINASGCINTSTVQLVVNSAPSVTASASPANSVCLGGTVNLIGSGAATYSWIPNNQTGSTVNITPASSTNYTVIGTSALGCTATATRSITVVANPTVGASSNPTAICVFQNAVLTATGATAYTWNPGGSTSNPNTVSPGANTTFTVSGNLAGCTSTATVLVVVNALPNLTVTASPTAICPSGVANIISTGATNYTVMPGSLVGSNVTVSPASTQIYTVTGINASGCINTRTVQLVVNSAPSVTASASPANSVCVGGTVNLIGSGAATYSWIPNNQTGATVNITPASSTNYTVIGTSALGCTATATRSITVVANPTVGASSNPTAICVFQNAVLTATGATAYTWNPGGSTSNPNTVSPGANTTFTVTGNVAGCSSTATVLVVVNALPNLTVTASPTAICPGGVANIISTGATSYTVNPGSLAGSNVTVSPVSTQVYTVSGVNASGCLNTRTVQLVVNSAPTVSASASPANSVCLGGTVNLIGSGASTYSWIPNNQTGATVNVTPASSTNYTVIGTSALGCTATATRSITVVPIPTIGATASPTAICVGATAALTATGGASYTWNPGASTSNPFNVSPAGNTTYTVTGSVAGCTSNAVVSLVVNALPNLTVTASPTAICPGGVANIISTGATNYTVNPGSLVGSNVTVSPVSSQIYTVTGLNASGCINTRTVQLVVNPTTTILATSTSPSVCSGNSVTLSASGAITYTWNPGNLNGSFVSVSPSVSITYSVIGTNSSGCITSQATVPINVIISPTVSANANPTSICVGNTATLTSNGAQFYTWQPGGASNSLVIVGPVVTTIYTVTGFATGGVCFDTETVSLVVNALPSVSVTASPTAICPGAVANLISSGATSYTVNPGALVGSNVTVSPVSTTIYTVTGLNAFGCIGTRTVQLIVNPIPTVGATTSSNTICAGSSAVLTGTGATSYTWNPMGTVGTTVSVSPTITTTYTVIGASALGCTNQNTITITVNPIPSVSVSTLPSAICPGASATLSATGATTYSWNTGSTSAIITVTNAATYTVTGTTGLCSATRTINVGALPGVTLTASANPTAICPSGVAICSVTGAVNYTWNTGANTNTISVSPSVTTIYSVTGTNGFGCAGNTTVQVIVNPVPTVTASASPTIVCAGNTLNLSASGASTYTWNPGNLNGALLTVTPTASTIYTVNGTSALGCVGVNTVAITVVPNPTLGATASPATICAGATAVLTATGATSYTWNPVSLIGTPITVTPAVTTIYTLTGSSLGCSSTRTVQVTVNSNPTLTAGSNPTAICLGASANLTVTGANSYTWQPINLSGASQTVSPLATIVYTVTGTNAAGCIDSDTVQLIVNPIPSVSVSPSSFTICSGGFVNLNASGASVYSWNPGAFISPTLAASPTITTVYTITGASSFGCLGQTNATVNVQALPVVSISATSTLICPGTSATLSASGGTFYSWSTGSTATNIVVSPTTTTTYSLVGSNGLCTSTAVAITVSLNVAPTLSITGNSTICVGNSTSLTASGASNYTWNPGGLNTAAVVLSPTTTTAYTLTGANAFGCTTNQTFSVVVNPTPNISASALTPTVCFGSSTTLTVTGGTSYTWNPGNLNGAGVTVTPAINTIYTVSANNAFGCNSQTTVPVTVQSLPVVSATAAPASICVGGSSTLTAVGASSFLWSNSVALATTVVSPASTTIYSVIGVVGTCTSNITTVTVVVNSLPTLSITASPSVICQGGSATLTAIGASSYTWNPGAANTTSIVVTPASSTTYTLNGANGFGCLSAQTVSLGVNPNPTVIITPATATICAGACSTLSAIGANNYTWMPGGLTGSNAVVCPTLTTTYTITGESLGCLGTSNQTIQVNALPTITATAIPASICNGNSSTLTASGANTYSWITIPSSSNPVVVSPTINTSYVVSGTNAAGCVSSQTVGVAVNSLPSITITSTSNTICVGASATLTGAGTLSYTWNPSGSNASTLAVSPSATTVYTLTGSNGAGCTSNQFFTLVVVPIPTVVASASSPSVCEGFSVNLIGTGANAYTWTPGNFTGSLIVVNPTVTTTYTLFGDVSGCTANSTISILVNPLPTITAVSSPTAICNGAIATLSANGAVSYTWIPGLISATSITVNPTSTTIYSVAGLNSFGCPNFTFLTLNVLATPTVIASSSSSAICIGGSATLTGNGASTYTWNPGNITGSSTVVNPSSTTIYTLTGSNGACSTNNTISIVVNPLPIITTNASSTVTCAGGAITFTALGGSTYTWIPGSLNGSTTLVNPTITTIYTVTGTDANGCNNTANVSVSVNPLPTLTITANPSATICNGATTSLNVSGAINYTWSPLNLNTNIVTVNPTINTTYTATGIDANGCAGTETILVNVVPLPTMAVTPANPTICAGYNTTLTATGVTNYTWLPSNANGSTIVINPTSNTSYTLVGDNGGNCPATLTVGVFVNPLPIITASSSSTVTCFGSAVSFTALGANTYTWIPGNLNGSTTVVNPTASIIYTVTGTDANGCDNTANITMSVNALPILSVTAAPSLTICNGATTSLNGNGALTYTWLPSGLNTNPLSVSPTANTTYTLNGTDANGCIGTETAEVVVVPIPTINITPLNSTICVGFDATLTAVGATNYTWMPINTNGSVAVVNPVATTIYTVTGDNGGNCPAIITATVLVNPLPANVSAISNGIITCANQTVTISGSTTDTDVTYYWVGPGTFTSGAQSTTVNAWGNYSLTVTNTITGCVRTVVLNVPTDNSIPSVTATTSGTITCAVPTVTLNAANTTTNAGYLWNGPNGFTSIVQSFTSNTNGNYTVTVTDLTSGCARTETVSVFSHTYVSITATITPATCSLGISNNDGKIEVSNFTVLDKFTITTGTVGTGSFTNAVSIPSTGILTNNLSNPTTTVNYTIRLFDTFGCFKDTTLILVPVDCVPKVLGIAKSVVSSTLNTDGTYNVTYKIAIKNTDTAPINNVVITENLVNTYPSPTTFTVVNAPVISAAASSLVINSLFDGLNQTNMTTANSILGSNTTDTIQFTVKVTPNGYFGPFKNRVIGTALTSMSVAIRDTSNNGLIADPDNDLNPTNNNIETPIVFTRKVSFGITKVGEVSTKLSNNTYDVSYTITVHNLGNDTLRNVNVKDSLFGKVVKAPARYTMRSAPVASGNLIVNPLFDGKTVTDLLLSNTSKMLPGEQSNIRFTINVQPDSLKGSTLSNSAYGNALARITNTSVTLLSDTSANGTNPDINQNGICNETEDNMPTVLILPATMSSTLFIPEGFSPNGDGINDLFVINGLPLTSENSITIFNRWGNRVYYHANYANNWDGYPNIAGTLGKDKLPQGTYFYILEFKGSGQKPITGFVVLQY